MAREEDHGVSVRCVRRSEKRRTPRSGDVEKDARSLGCRTARRATSLETATSAARAPTRRVGRPAVHESSRATRFDSRTPSRATPRGSPRTRPSSSPRPASCRRAREPSHAAPRGALAAPSPRRRRHVCARAPPSRRRREPGRTPRERRRTRRGARLQGARRRPARVPNGPEPRDPRDPRDPARRRPRPRHRTDAPSPSRRDERPFPRRASPRGPHRHAPRDKKGRRPPGRQPREPLAGPTDVCAFAPGRASPAATAARARRRADGGRGVYRGGTRETRRGARRSVRDAASLALALALALAPAFAAPSASTAVSVFPSLSRDAFSSSIPSISALSSTADAPLPAPPGGAGAPVVGTRVGAVDAPRAAPTPRAAASRAVVRRDGRTRPLIPAVARGIRARRCHARASEPRRAPIVIAAAAVGSVERRVPREPRGRPVGRPDRASLVVGRVVAPSTTAPESSPESSPNAFAAFPTASSLTPAAAPDAPAPAEAVAPAAPEVCRGHGRPRCRRVRGAPRGGGGDGRSLHDPRDRDDPRVRRRRSRVARRAGTSSGSRGLGAEPASRAGLARRVLSDDGRGVPGDVRRPGNDALRIRRRLRVGGAGRGRSAARERRRGGGGGDGVGTRRRRDFVFVFAVAGPVCGAFPRANVGVPRRSGVPGREIVTSGRCESASARCSRDHQEGHLHRRNECR